MADRISSKRIGPAPEWIGPDPEWTGPDPEWIGPDPERIKSSISERVIGFLNESLDS